MKKTFLYVSVSLLLSFVSYAYEKDVINNFVRIDGQGFQPLEIAFIYGQNLLELGTERLRLDLTALGADAFDQNTVDMPVSTPQEGWVHYIMNPSWHGLLILWEADMENETKGQARYMYIHAGDEGNLVTSTAIYDVEGVFAIATEKGVMLRAPGGNGYYFPVSEALGLNRLESVRLSMISHDPELEQKALEVRFEGASVKGVKIGVFTKEIGYLAR